MYKKSIQGFTLIELLIVIGILAILLAITIIAINPAKQFDNARGQSLLSGATQMVNALEQCWIENGASWAKAEGVCWNLAPNPAVSVPLSSNTPITPLMLIGNSTIYPTFNMINLCPLVINGYLPGMPQDPKNTANPGKSNTTACNSPTTDGYAGYYMNIKNNHVTITISSGYTLMPNYTGPISITK